MFANTHRSKPVIRFSKFHDSWEPRELNAVMSDFIVPMRDKPKQFGGTIPWTRIDDIDGKYLNESKSGNYVVDCKINPNAVRTKKISFL